MSSVVMDAAGGATGGAARWRYELDAYLSTRNAAVTMIGRGQQLTPRWLIHRERLVRSATIVVAPNNVSFATGRGERIVLLRNALHFLHRAEGHLLAGMPASFRAQIPIVRRLSLRADTIVVPCSAMADRVTHHLPRLAGRIAVRPHPVTPIGQRIAVDEPFVLAPIVPGPYKNLMGQLRLLAAAADDLHHPARIWVTASASQLPADLVAHPRIEPVGPMSHERLAELWRTATAAFYPSITESFGYPLAEARAYGVPIIAADTAQTREIAGPALRGYEIDSFEGLQAALSATDQPVIRDARPFARDSYFDWLLKRPVPNQRGAVSTSREGTML